MFAAVLLERRMIGAGLIACVLLGLAISNLSSAFMVQRMARGAFVFEILTVNAVLYTFGVLGMHLLIFEDMTYELRVANRRLETAKEDLLQAAITDPLTGCHNRRFLDQVMDRELQRLRGSGFRCRCSSSTSTASKPSTTRSAMRPAIESFSTWRAS